MKKIFTAISFVLSLAIYILTIAPDVYYTDSGELAAVASSLGIAHPTGYPLFTLIGHLWSNLLPWSAVFNLNLMAAVATAISSAFIFLTSFELITNIGFKKKVGQLITELDDLLLSLFIAQGYSFALTTWKQATSVEVYSLQLVIITLYLYLVTKAYFTKEDSGRLLIAAGFTLGLGFANHLTSFMLIPAGLIVLFTKTSKQDRWKLFSFVVAVTLLGFLLYIYLPVRSSQSPEFNWGAVHRSFDKFWYHVTGAQYQVWMFSDGNAWKENFKLFFSLIPAQLTWIGVLFLLFGLFTAFKQSRTIFYILISTLFLCLFYSLNYSIHDIDSYFITAYIAMFLIMLIGAKQLINKQKNLLYLFAFIPLFNLYANYSDSDLSEDYSVSEYERIIIESAEKDAIIISAQWDFWVSARWYNDKIEGERTDISLIEKELLRRTWYLETMKQWYPKISSKCEPKMELFDGQLEKFESDKAYDPRLIQSYFIDMLNCYIDSNIDTRPVYVTFDILQSEPEVGENYVKIPEGFLIRLSKQPEPMKFDYSNLDVLKLAKSVNSKDDELHNMTKNLALVNLKAASNYAQYANNLKLKEIIDKKIQLFGQ
ncbi:MAG: DUF2723 domain-containing protein [Chlorobiota bacterium]